jgi:hypothetical protein
MDRAAMPTWVGLPTHARPPAAAQAAADAQIDLFASVPLATGSVRLNLEDWAAGDVILFRAGGGSVVQRGIAAYQRRAGVSQSGSEVAHVAIYDGCGCLWDARPRKNIQQTALWRVAQSIELARVRLINVKPDTDRLHRALAASKSHRYSLKLISHLIYGLVGRQLNFKPAKREEADKAAKRHRDLVICSTFVERVLVFSTGAMILDAQRVTLPGDYVDEGRFSFEPLIWRRC